MDGKAGFWTRLGLVIATLLCIILMFQVFTTSSATITDVNVNAWLTSNGYVAYGASPGLTAGQVPYATGANNLESEAGFEYDAATNTFSVLNIEAPTGFNIFIASVNATAQEKAHANYLCDGTADEVQIQAAIVASAGGGISLSSSTFNIADTIDFSGYDGLSIIGAGKGSTTINMSDLTKSIMKCTTKADNVHLKGMKLKYANGEATADALNFKASSGTYHWKWIIDDVEVYNGGAGYYALSVNGFLSWDVRSFTTNNSGGFMDIYNNVNDKSWGDSAFTNCVANTGPTKTLTTSFFKIRGTSGGTQGSVNLLGFYNLELFTGASAVLPPSTYVIDLANNQFNQFNNLHVETYDTKLMNVSTAYCASNIFNLFSIYATDGQTPVISLNRTVGTYQKNEFTFNESSFGGSVIESKTWANQLINCYGYTLNGFADIKNGHTLIDFHPEFESLDGCTVTGTATLLATGGFTLTTSGNGTGASTLVKSKKIIGRFPTFGGATFSRNIQLFMGFMTKGNIADLNWYLGVGSFSPITDRHIGIKVGNDAKLYGTIADGTTEETIDLGVTVTTYNYHKITIYLFATEGVVTFTVDGAYVGRLSTNIPTGTTDADYVISAGITEEAAAIKSIDINDYQYILGEG